MKGSTPSCEVLSPSSLSEAFEILNRGRWRPLAGGTDLMVLLAAGTLPDRRFLDLGRLADLKGIAVSSDAVTLGALTTFSELRRHPVVSEEFPNLADGARLTGALAIQNRGTVGGNIVNGSPAADTPPSLLAYAAEVELRNQEGSRWVPYDAFHTGYKTNAMLPGELLTRVRLPRVSGEKLFHYYRKVGTRKAQAISKVCLSLCARMEDGILAELRIGVGSVAPVPLRARRTEDILGGHPIAALPVEEARRSLLAEIVPIDDIRSNARYRRTVAGSLLVEALERLRDRS